nr:relaxase/mobilization nuclease domain-containing protein [Marinomonas vulgaris]
MIVKFFRRGAGRGSGSVDYLLGKNRDREGATLDRGDPDMIQDLIDSSPYAKKYTSGVLSFAEPDLSREIKDDLMTSFERALFPGLEKDQYSVLWVEHRDKERLELNFVIPNVELTTGKRLQPWFEKADKPRINAWKSIANIAYGLHDPDDPINQREMITPRDLPPMKQQASQAITDSLMMLAKAGVIHGRDDVVNALQSGGFTISRTTKTSISIADPDGGRNIRLKGLLYEQDFRHGAGLRAEIEGASQRYRAATQERLQSLRTVYQRGISRKREELQKRHPRLLSSHVVGDPKDVVLALSERGNRGSNVMGNRPVPALRHSEQLPTDPRPERDHPNIERPGRKYVDQSLREDQTTVRSSPSRTGVVWGGRRELHDPKGELDDDRARKTAIERIRGFTENARRSAQGLRHGVQKLREHVQHYLVRERDVTPRSEPLERASQRLEQSIGKIDQIVTQKERERQKTRGMNRGLGF